MTNATEVNATAILRNKDDIVDLTVEATNLNSEIDDIKSYIKRQYDDLQRIWTVQKDNEDYIRKIKEVINKVIGIIGHGEPDYGKIAYRESENMNLHADISKALKILNWEPKVSLDDGLRLTINSYKD